MEDMVCLRCGERLIFNSDKGCVHRDGSVYKNRLDYPRFCRKCMDCLRERFCYAYDIQYGLEKLDDHWVMPVSKRRIVVW